MLVVCGSECLHPLFTGVAALARGVAKRLVVSGGVGHATSRLYAAVQKDARLVGVKAEPPLTEGAVMRQVALALGADSASVFAEELSTNCGSNAVETRRLLERLLGVAPRRIIVLQDPTMMRRTHETFLAAWADVPGAEIRSWASFIPATQVDNSGRLVIASPPCGDSHHPCLAEMLPPQWDVPRFVGLCLGEIPRLRDDAHGYGPLGKGFIGHVDIPVDVEAAYTRLAARHAPR